MSYKVNVQIMAKIHMLPAGIKKAVLDINAILNVLEKYYPYESWSTYIDSGFEGFETTSYDFDFKQLNSVSSELPGIVLSVESQGEEPDDHTLVYYYNGKSHEAIMTWSPFDKTKLK